MITNGENFNLKIQLAQELEKAARFQKLNQELYDYLIATILWIMKYVKEHNINPPNKDKLNELVSRIHLQMDKTDGVMFSPTESQQGIKQRMDQQNLKYCTLYN